MKNTQVMKYFLLVYNTYIYNKTVNFSCSVVGCSLEFIFLNRIVYNYNEVY